MYNNILLAADGSEHSERAADHAIQFASLDETSVIDLLLVIDMSESKTEVLETSHMDDLDKERRQRLATIEEKLNDANVNYHLKIIHGDPGPSIVSYANQRFYDILIIGSRGLNPWQEMVLGSVSHKVAKRVKCPVLIVK
ncbi:universal stress protein [Natribacillus halophilus]|uniref:Nucleotide-binding universal stress protein, UspA family n=1 Tax=Natribacillus halophilus TaxID=549003 RepID=A0A1G8S1W5_9BACI|nr:universal stress protein [Natribacillus halophilus]SDJ23112.1 Nucleotide-binding universal stress protein, UspA family [Natribacillus halophilus]